MLASRCDSPSPPRRRGMTRLVRPARAFAFAALVACLASCQPLGPVPIALASRPPLTEKDLGLETAPDGELARPLPAPAATEEPATAPRQEAAPTRLLPG